MNYWEEKQYLRELAKKYLDIAALPVMETRIENWYRHNAGDTAKPMVIMEMLTFEEDMLPPLVCTSKYGREIEKYLQTAIINHEMIDDDKVVTAEYKVPLNIQIHMFDQEIKREYAKDSRGVNLGFREIHPIQDLERDFPSLKHSTYTFHADQTAEHIAFAQDILGDLMPVIETNKSLDWYFCISQRVVELMGMENMMIAMIETPEAVTQLYDFVLDDMLRTLHWMENNNLLRPNNGNDYSGAGSYGFSDELDVKEPIKGSMLWGNTNSQETITVSPQMYHDLVSPAYHKLAKHFGLLYYGCCEPIDKVWEDIRTLHNLRKVSVSAWCNEDFMGEALKGSKIIYSRKPSPNYIGVEAAFDADAYRSYIRKTMEAARGCNLEVLCRDIYALNGNRAKVKEAVQIIREEAENVWVK